MKVKFNIINGYYKLDSQLAVNLKVRALQA